MQSAKVSKREIQDPDIPDLSLSKLKSVSSFNRFDLNDDVSDKAIPRQKPNIKPEALPVFDEISDSKYGQKLSPNNVSSFIELLNYNSDSENDQPKDKLRVRKNIDGRAARQAENSGNDDPRETTQDFIQSTLVNMNSPPPTAPKKSPVSKVNLNVGAPVPPSPKNKSGLSPNSLVNRRAFEKLDEKLSKHPLCSFAGLPFVNPSKHSSKLVISEIPESVNMSKIKPLVRT
jgi:hypothetical protein